MRRMIALILMFIVPLQFAWSATASLHGHAGEDVAALGLHAHDHDYHDAGHAGHDISATADQDGHNGDGHHGSHCHHVLSFILPVSDLTLGLDLSGGPIQHPLTIFFTRTPPRLERPPLAFA